MIEKNNKNEIKISTEKNFGIVFSIFFLIISFYPLIYQKNINYWTLVISFIFLTLGIFFPKILKKPNYLWFKFGIFLGSIISPIIMGLVFFFTVTPTGIMMRLMGKDILKQKIDKKTNSYWINSEQKDQSMKNQF